MNTNNKKNIVIKIGTTSIIKNDKVDITLLKSLAELIIENKNQFNFVIVTSGAVGLGATKLNYKSRPKSLKTVSYTHRRCRRYQPWCWRWGAGP